MRRQSLFALVGVSLQDVDEASLHSRATGDNKNPKPDGGHDHVDY